ncbi:MAG: hypothetical protein HF962_05820 [Sulfurovum sp.]|nr:hypothetical protein [Sulfurovum sp.]
MNKITTQTIIAIFSTTTIDAANASKGLTEEYEIYLWIASTFLLLGVLVLFYINKRQKRQLTEASTLITEKDEKITWLRQINAKNEQEKISKEHKAEKRIIELTHTIETLEEKSRDGTKNQVVAKIEALQSKRARQMKLADLEVGE